MAFGSTCSCIMGTCLEGSNRFGRMAGSISTAAIRDYNSGKDAKPEWLLRRCFVYRAGRMFAWLTLLTYRWLRVANSTENRRCPYGATRKSTSYLRLGRRELLSERRNAGLRAWQCRLHVGVWRPRREMRRYQLAFRRASPRGTAARARLF